MVGVLVLLALVLITFSFRQPDDGPLASAQSSAAAVLRPFTIAGDRVAQPFRDVYAWADSLLTARSDAKKLREENAMLRQQAIQNQFAANENDKLKALLAFRDGPRFPDDYKGLAAAVIARPTGGLRAGRRRRRRLERRRHARRAGRDRGRLPRPCHARLLALRPGDAAHRRAAGRLRARRQERRRRDRQARARVRVDPHLRPRAEEAEGLGRATRSSPPAGARASSRRCIRVGSRSGA